MNNAWTRLADGVCQTRLPFLDVTVGLVWGSGGVLVIDSGTTRIESRAIDEDVREMTGRAVSHLVLTHHHFEHVLGSSVFTGAADYGAPEVVAAMSTGIADLRADAVRHGVNAAALTEVSAARTSAGPAAGTPITTWPRSLDRVLAAGGPHAIYVPGHGAAVDADFVRRQRDWLVARLGRRPGSAR